MPVTFTWEFNPVTLIAIGGSLLTAVKFWFDNRAKAEEACKMAREAMEEARTAREQVTILQAAFSAYRETQAERLVSREVLREVEARLTGAVDRLGDRLDEIVKTALKQRGPS